MAKYWNILAIATVLVLAVVLGVEAWVTPASPFDPIGSGRVPFVTAVLLAVIGTFALALDLKRSKRPEHTLDSDRPRDSSASIGTKALAPILLCFLTIGFAGSLQGTLAPLPVLIFLFLGLAGLVLAWPISHRISLVVLLVVAVTLAVGLEAIFTQFLYIRFD